MSKSTSSIMYNYVCHYTESHKLFLFLLFCLWGKDAIKAMVPRDHKVIIQPWLKTFVCFELHVNEINHTICIFCACHLSFNIMWLAIIHVALSFFMVHIIPLHDNINICLPILLLIITSVVYCMGIIWIKLLGTFMDTYFYGSMFSLFLCKHFEVEFLGHKTVNFIIHCQTETFI